MNISDAEVSSQMRKPKFVAFSVVSNETREVPHTEEESTEEPKNKVAIHEECPKSNGKVTERTRYWDKLRQCSHCREDKTEDSTSFSEIASLELQCSIKEPFDGCLYKTLEFILP